MFGIDGLNHRDHHGCIQKTLDSLFFAQDFIKSDDSCIQSDKHKPPATITGLEEKNTMELQYLEFDCSEDTEGVVCWHAAQGTLDIHIQLTLSPGEIGIQQQMAALQRFQPFASKLLTPGFGQFC